jgi:hypothetical protein
MILHKVLICSELFILQAIKKLLGKKEVDKNAEVNKKLLKAAKILERMVNQNTYNEIAQGDKIQNNFINIIL